MAVEVDVIAHLEDQATLVAMVGDRIYPSVRPQESALPAVVYQRISTPRRSTHTGPSGLAWPRFQFTTWGRRYSEAIDVAAEVRFALDGFQGTMGGTYVCGIHVVNELDDRDEETGHWRRILDAVMWHREAVG